MRVFQQFPFQLSSRQQLLQLLIPHMNDTLVREITVTILVLPYIFQFTLLMGKKRVNNIDSVDIKVI